ncbi:MAG: hypothetical protein AUK35_10845 [Zetaproteobacteria bacterium CG2_30_46_52]|nr:MAG: hypothetical protein AUK35_10845 [Zetaproteobacteria bacterium CG2_30_46_52]
MTFWHPVGLCLAVMFLAFGAVQNSAAATHDCFPFVGEKMKFDVDWEFVNAGTAEVNITAEGQDGYKVHNFARTNRFLDIFKKVRDTIVSEGICLDKTMQSTVFTADQKERSYSSTKEALYLWQEGKVKYTKKGRVRIYDVPKGHLNVLDAFYLTRMAPPSKDTPISIPVFDSGEKYDLVVKWVKEAKLQAPWGELVNCIVIEPELKTEGVFTSVGKVQVWLTDDERRIPLKITAKIKIGSIVVDLTSYSKNT